MGFELTGKVKLIEEPQTFGSGFTKRQFVLTVQDGKYDQDIALECVQDKVSILDPISVGQEITATFDIRGREHSGRYFNNLVCWKIQVNGAAQPANRAPTPQPEDEDSIPF